MSKLFNKLSTVAKPVGFSLIAISSLAWIAVFVIPFLDLSGLQMAGIITGLIIFAEICFYIAILLLGKPLWNKLKEKLLNKLTEAKDAKD